MSIAISTSVCICIYVCIYIYIYVCMHFVAPSLLFQLTSSMTRGGLWMRTKGGVVDVAGFQKVGV